MLLARRIRALRWLFLLAAVLAVLIALAASYRVSLSPPGLEEKTSPYAVSSVQLLVDTESESAISDATVAPEALATRGTIYAALADSDRVRAQAAQLAGLPVDAFSVFTLRQTTRSTAGDTGALVNTPPAGATGVTIFTTSGSPLLRVDGQAPTGALARRITDGVAQALQNEVARFAQVQRVPVRDRIVIRRFGEAKSAVVSNKESLTAVAKVAIGTWIVLMLIILALDLLRLQARSESRGRRV